MSLQDLVKPCRRVLLRYRHEQPHSLFIISANEDDAYAVFSWVLDLITEDITLPHEFSGTTVSFVEHGEFRGREVYGFYLVPSKDFGPWCGFIDARRKVLQHCVGKTSVDVWAANREWSRSPIAYSEIIFGGEITDGWTI